MVEIADTIEDKAPPPQGANKKLLALGLITVIWLTVAFALGWNSHVSRDCDLGTYRCLSANEWGDFLAGVFAPIAFLWLVGTVMIQSDELREQRNELTVTRNVMKKQAAEAQKQAEFIGLQTKIFQQEKNDEQLRMKLKHFRHFILSNFGFQEEEQIDMGNYRFETRKHEAGYLTVNTPEDVDLFFVETVNRLHRAISIKSKSEDRRINHYIDCPSPRRANQLIGLMGAILSEEDRVGPAMQLLLRSSGALTVLTALPNVLDHSA